MNFKPELIDLILSGRKTQTRRPVSDNPRSPWYREKCGLQVGRDYAICPGRAKPASGRVLIEATRLERLGDISSADAVAEGFRDRNEFEIYLWNLYGEFDPEQLVWVVQFRRGG